MMKPTKTVKPKQDKKDNKKETRESAEKALEEPTELNVNGFVVAVYERKVYVGKVHGVDDNEAYIHFLAHNGTLTRNSKFRDTKVMDDVWLSFVSILFITPEPEATKRALQRHLILFSEMFRNGRNIDNVKIENTLVT